MESKAFKPMKKKKKKNWLIRYSFLIHYNINIQEIKQTCRQVKLPLVATVLFKWAI